MNRKDALFLILSTAAAAAAAAAASSVGSVPGSSQVKESTARYSCCGNPELKFNPHCENTWSVNDKTIAYSDDVNNNCAPPCRKIGDGLMTLDTCVDVNVTIRCDDSMKMTVEEIIYYQSQTCSAVSNRMARGNQGSIWLLLLAMVIAGWM